jgi:SAM-dependent methyltransferase
MTTTWAGAKGYAPKVIIKPIEESKKDDGKGMKISGEDVRKLFPNVVTEETKKYIRCWEEDQYRENSPGQKNVPLFLRKAEPEDGATVVDWGCGTGRAGYDLYKEKNMDVTLVDFAYNCLDDNVKEEAADNDRLRFIEHDITKPIELPSEYGYCCDVMEHLPEEQVSDALENILQNSHYVFFQISTMQDAFGSHPCIAKDGKRVELHLTVKPYQWWLEKLVEKQVVIHYSQDFQNSCVFYVTGWGSINLQKLQGTVNISDEQILANMEENAKLGIQQMRPHEEQDIEIMLLAGGPSLNDCEEDIIQKRKDGMPMVTVNGAYNWAIERGLSPSMQMVIDGKEHNKRFTRLVDGMTDKTKYLIASQCDPSVFEGLPHDRTYMWQVSLDPRSVAKASELFGKKYEDWFPTPGGSTCTLRGLCALQMLGFKRINIYGLDSCLYPGKDHHAYEQPENDHQRKKWTKVTIARGTEWEREFKCLPWHMMQINDFVGMVGRVLNCDYIVHGDGAIAHILKVGAGMAEKDGISSEDQQRAVWKETRLIS